MDVQTGIAASALVLSLIALLRGELHQRRRAPDDAQRRAVENVREALVPVLAFMEHADINLPTKAEVSSVMLDFERDCQRWEHMLPAGARHLRTSTREAMANCFGAPASVALDPRIDDMPMNRFDRYWWDVGYTYLDYVRARFGRWLVEDRRRPLKVIHYHQWRRDEDRHSSVHTSIEHAI